MKILFIKPPRNKLSLYGDSNIEPLEFEILAAILRRHHDVSLLDMRLDSNLEYSLKTAQPDLVGLTGYTIDVYSILSLARKIKTFDPRIIVVVGGHHASLMPQDFYNPYVDFVVIGNGEVSLVETVASLEEGKGLELIPGICINSEKEQIRTERRAIPTNLIGLPIPERGLTKAYRSQYFSGSYRPMAAMITSRGCPFRCKFCSIWKFMDGKYLARNVETVADELGLIDEKNVFFVDDNLTSDARHFELLYNEIKIRGIQKNYKAYGRTDAIVKRPDLIEKWAKIGLKQVTLGVEAIEDKDLQLLNKHNTAKNNIEAIKILKNNGIDIKTYFIINPEFGKAEFSKLMTFVEKMQIESPSFSILTPLPGTDLYEETREKICLRNYEFYDLAHSVLPTVLPRKEFYKQFVSLYSRSYSIRKFASHFLANALKKLSGDRDNFLYEIPFKKVFFYSFIMPRVCKSRYRKELI